MSNVIQFLETLGSNPALARRSAAEYAATVASLDVGDAERQSLLVRDHAALSDLLGGRAKMLCSIFPSEHEEQKDDNQREHEEPLQDTPPESE